MVYLCKTYTTRKGISLVETLVAVALFSIVMMVAVGALVSLIDANRKARSEKTVVNNLSVSLEQMVREIREGTGHTIEYGGSKIQFYTREGVLMEYYLKTDNRIYRRKGGGTETPLTAPGVYIGDLTFFTANVGGDEPAIQIFMRGRSGNSADTQSDFRLQTTVAGRSREVQAIVTVSVPTSAGEVETASAPTGGTATGGTVVGNQYTDVVQLGSSQARNNECHSPGIVGAQPLSRITFDTDPFGDSSGGSLVNAYNGASYTSNGNWCGAVSLDGYNDYVDYQDSSRFQNMHSGLTVAAWIYPTGWGSGAARANDCTAWKRNDGSSNECASACIIGTDSFGGYEVNGNGWSFFIDASGRFGFNVDNGTYEPVWKVSQPGTITLNKWQHVAFTWNGSHKYENGIQLYYGTSMGGGWTQIEASGSNSWKEDMPGDDSANPIMIGACRGWDYSTSPYQVQPANFFQGKIDDLRIYPSIVEENILDEASTDTSTMTDTCPANKPKQCGNYCVPDSAVCCGNGSTYCSAGNQCTTDGKCATGATTNTQPSCGSGYKLVNNQYCIPNTAVYCGNGNYCASGSCPVAGNTCVGPTGSIIQRQGIPVKGYDI